MQSAAVQRAIKLAGTDPKRWTVLIKHMSNLKPDERAEALERLDATFEKLNPVQERALLEELRSEVEKQKRFPNTKWVLPPEELKLMLILVDKHTSNDPREKARILFDSSSFDADGNRDSIDRMRQTTLQAILAQSGQTCAAGGETALGVHSAWRIWLVEQPLLKHGSGRLVIAWRSGLRKRNSLTTTMSFTFQYPCETRDTT
jgi:hypothetical protein